MGLSEIAFGAIGSLVAGFTQDFINSKISSFPKRRKIANKVEEVAYEVVEALSNAPEISKLGQVQTDSLIQICRDELTAFIDKPEQLFNGSLDGNKIFENRYPEGQYPAGITDKGLSNAYSIVFPRIATLLCKTPQILTAWESEAWSENFRRLDDLAIELIAIFDKVDKIDNKDANQADELLLRVRKFLAQRISLKLDTTGLRANTPQKCKLEDLFVLPTISTKIQAGDRWDDAKVINEQTECFEYFVCQQQLSIIFGAPGSGKSTWVDWLKWQNTTQHWGGIIINSPLREANLDALPSFKALVQNEVGNQFKDEVDINKIRQWLNKNLITFVFDGFDEIVEQQRQKVLNWIIDIADATNSAIIITSRELTTHHLADLSDKWQNWQLEPFDQPRVIEYISKWYKHSEQLENSDKNITPKQLANSWKNEPTIKPLTGNPLLLSTLLMVHHLDGKLPSGRAKLYERYVDGMLGIWDERRNVNASALKLNSLQQRKILRKFAIHMQFSGVDSIEEAQAIEVFKQICSELDLDIPPIDVLNYFTERSGLIIGPGVYNFAHKSISEYLVAECIKEGDSLCPDNKKLDRLRLLEYCEDDRWNTIIFLWAGIESIGDVEVFILQCYEKGSYSLAYGILVDQFDKFSIDFIKQMIANLHSLTESCFIETNRGIAYIFGQAEFEKPYAQLDYIGFRSVGAHYHLGDLISLSVKKCNLLWKDIPSLNDALKTFFWNHFLNMLNSCEEIKNLYINNPFNQLSKNSQDMLFLSEVIFSLVRKNASMPIDNILQLLSNLKLYKNGMMQLSALSFIQELVDNKFISTNRFITVLYKILGAKQLDEQAYWLLKTTRWQVNTDGFEFVIVDLLKHALIWLNTLESRTTSKQSDQIEQIITAIEELITLRESMQQEENKKPALP